MVQMVAIQGIATNLVMRESLPGDSLHTGIWKTDTLKEVTIKGSSILQSGDRMKVCSFLYLVDYIVPYSYCKLTIIFSIPNSTCQSSILFLVSIYILHSSS